MSAFNRLFDSTGDRALKSANRLKLDIWRKESGDVCAEYEIRGAIGSICTDDEDEGGVKEPTDLELIRQLLERFQRRED